MLFRLTVGNSLLPSKLERSFTNAGFEKVAGPDQTAIDEFVDAHFFSSRKA